MSTANDTTVSPDQRFTPDHPCPVCGGHQLLPRGRDQRCAGFVSGSGRFAFCSRQESPDSIGSASGTLYKHRLDQSETRPRLGRKKPPRVYPTPSDAIRWAHKGERAIGRIAGEWPYHDADGSLVLVVYRLDTGEIDPQTGKPSKEFRPVGRHPGGWINGDKHLDPLPLYRLPELIDADLVIVTEGEKAAEAIWGLGLAGTSPAHGAESPRRSDWSPLAGKTVAILPDNDEKGRKFARSVASILAGLKPAPEVKVVHLSGLPEKGDAREYVDAGGTADELLRLIESAPLVEAEASADGPPRNPSLAMTGADGDGPNEAGDDPHRLARLFLDTRYRHDGVSMIRFHGDEFIRWNGSAWGAVSEKELRAELASAAKAEFDRLNVEAVRRHADPRKPTPTARKVTGQLVGNVALALSGETLLPESVESPAWIDGPGPFPASEVLPTRNGLVHLPSLVEAQDYLAPPTPRFFNTYALGYAFDSQAPEPVEWFRFLDSLWPDDPESISTLEEWFGYCLTPDTRQQKALALIGPRRSGKGTIARVLRELIGVENVAGPTLSTLAGPFGLQPLVGKPAAIISDARLSSRTDQAVIVERLLTITGEDTLTVDRKHRPAWSGKLPTRITFISNELPRLADQSKALAGRFVVLKLVESFFGSEDTNLTDRLMGELPGILHWAISGWARLRERGHFVQPQSGAELIADIEALSSPVSTFLSECCVVEPGRLVEVGLLFRAWQQWCDSVGRDKPGNQQSFGRDLRAVLPKLQVVQRRDERTRNRHYEGIGLNPAFEQVVQSLRRDGDRNQDIF
ncbi:phage/plasmid primase, P4 family [Tautonia rosea]|uniref:phage/plasmid primase, P4 family n=1 Tax=Tautonia rosea TaxID=2728037 RepID=UPI00147270D0|nr:phage/plasmid primase, P4 family [Tautonia rosea]